MKWQRRAAAAVAALVLNGAGPAQAAMLVYDPTSYAKLIEQAKTALDQLDELKAQVQQGRQLLDSLNQSSNVSQLAAQLASPAVRGMLPDAAALDAAAKGDLSNLGPLAKRVEAIRASARLYTSKEGNADLEATGARAARDLALGQAVADAGIERSEGLQTLQSAIGSASNARAVLDLQARVAAEQAQIANDQLRLQGLAMAQAAEDRLQAQRDRERRLAESDARMAHYRKAFQ